VIVLGNLNGSAPQEIASKLGAVAHGEKVVMPSERKEAPVDPKLFSGYVGRYQLAPNFILTVTREENHLFTQATGQGKLQIYPESDRDYFLKVVDAQITFVIDSNGRATELILHQGGMDQHAKRIE
jgi:D-alanyl-D-alanine-carboxypeptidase/D-alanyl-D-alanine-endopeptidase